MFDSLKGVVTPCIKLLFDFLERDRLLDEVVIIWVLTLRWPPEEIRGKDSASGGSKTNIRS
jgi:hypothetical protein